MKKIKLILFLAVLFVCNINKIAAQVSSYTFAESAGTYAVLGGTNSTATGDDGIQDGIPIGFNFTMGGTAFTHFCINTNGWIKLGNAATTIGGSGWTNALGNAATHRPLIAALWDDNHRNTGAITYSTTGGAPNRILTVDWNNVNLGGGGSTSAVNLASFQIKVYETTNVVELIYSGTLALAGTLSASVGLNDNTSFLSVTPGAPGTASSGIANNAIAATTDMVGKKYTFTPASCSPPTALAASAITTTSANLSWTAATGATGYEWAVTTSATPPASGTATVLTSVSVASLTPGTVYYAHVRTNCGGTFSNWATIPFTTQCIAVGIPYSENFDGVTAPALPSCITTQDVNGNTTWNNGTTSPRSAPNCMIYNYNTALPADDWFYSAPLNLTAGTSYRVAFYYKARSATFPERLEVKYGNSNNAASMTTTLVTYPSITQTTYQLSETDFIPASTGIYFIGFHAYSLTDQFDLNVDDISVILSPSCGSPTSLATALSSSTAGTASWVAPVVGTPTGYEYVIDNVATDPAGAGTTNAGTSVAFSGLTPSTLYYLHVRTNCGGTFSAWATLPFTTLVNDNPCGAVALTLGGPQDCLNTTIATSVGDPALPGSCSSPNNTVWYTYTPATSGTVLVRTEIPGATTNGLNGWVAWYTATGTCPGALTFTPVAGSACQEFGQTGAGDVDSLTSVSLTAGVTYYIMIDGFAGDVGEFCIRLAAPPPPPLCTTNLTPANGATGVTSVTGGIPLTWNAAPGATSYDVFFGTTNPPTANIGNTTGTTANITGTAYNTTYYWYVVPRNAGGPATGCNTSTTSFTSENPTNCPPVYTTGCGLADSLVYFSLKGVSGTVIYNASGGICNTTPIAYSDFTSSFAPVTLARNESFVGKMRTGDPNDYATIWIDGDDDGFFEDNERVLDNLKIGTTDKLYSIYIPATMPVGIHRLRVRVIYSLTKPTALTHPCNSYAYGETEDYRVDITSTGSVRSVTPGLPGSCVDAAETTIGASSNNNGISPVYLLDSLNNLVCGIYPDGNNLGTVKASYYVHNGPVRQDVTGRYYLNRNLSIGVDTQPATPYRFRYFYGNSELNALIAQPGSGVTSQFDLIMTKTQGIECVTQYVQQSPTLQFPVGFGSLSGDRFLDFTGFTSFSRFFLHGGSSVLLPVTLTNLRGEVTGATNTVYWTTEQEQNNRKFIIERSADGSRFDAIGEINSLAPNGNSSSRLNYTFADNTPLNGKSYYRLRMVDLNDRQTTSGIVTLLRGKGKFEIVDVRPNPTTGLVYFNLLGNSTGATVVVRSLNGSEIMRKSLLQSASFSVDMSGFASGMYLLEATDRNGEKATFKIVKQ
jgi:GEVED domain